MAADDGSAMVAVLISPPGRAALAVGDTGTVIRLLRQARGWTQQELANCSGYSQATISRLERQVSRAARDTAILIDIAGALTVPPAVLGVTGAVDPGSMLDDVNRRGLLGGAMGLIVMALLPQSVATPGRIDAADVAQCWTALRRLNELVDHHGGGTVCQVAEGMASRLQGALCHGTYSPSVGLELQNVTAATMETAAWSAHDAGWPQRARRWWLETCHFAEKTNVPGVRVTALVTMALQAVRSGDGREALELIHTARETSNHDHARNPVLLSLFAAREAVGHAQLGDQLGAGVAIDQAREWLDYGRRGDEPFWLNFWGPADLAWHEMLVASAIRQRKSVEAAARTALSTADAISFPRNHTVYAANLGAILTQHGQFDEAISVMSEAMQGVHTIQGSGLAVSDLHRAVDLLGQQRYPPAKTFAVAARRLLPTK